MDKKFRTPRVWSNQELNKFGHLFSGKAINVSGWKDQDKEGRHYKDYFPNIDEYWVSNYKPEARGFQGNMSNELYIDLSLQLPNDHPTYDLVFNHTVLEHVFDVFIAFSNICSLSNDIVVIVVPFLQEQHADYGDYWRFTPQAIDMLFKRNGLKTLYISANNNGKASIYVFAIASKKPELWSAISGMQGNMINKIYSKDGWIGLRNIRNTFLDRVLSKIK